MKAVMKELRTKNNNIEYNRKLAEIIPSISTFKLIVNVLNTPIKGRD